VTALFTMEAEAHHLLMTVTKLTMLRTRTEVVSEEGSGLFKVKGDSHSIHVEESTPRSTSESV
jgi:hypothetical protein